jgi:hypothetical protein
MKTSDKPVSLLTLKLPDVTMFCEVNVCFRMIISELLGVAARYQVPFRLLR